MLFLIWAKTTLDKMALVDCFIDIDNSIDMAKSIGTNRSNIDRRLFRLSTTEKVMRVIPQN